MVAEKFIRELRLDRDKVNVNGGSIAQGHPIGATGAMLIGTLVDELHRSDTKRGLATMCAAGGMAPAIIVERVERGRHRSRCRRFWFSGASGRRRPECRCR